MPVRLPAKPSRSVLMCDCVDSHEDDPEALGERRLASFNIAPPLEVTVTEEEVRLLRSVLC